MIKKLLIANRGEIVNRIIKTCKKMNIETVAVYSDADKNAVYLRHANQSYNIGPSNPLKSYLNINSIINVAKEAGVDAIHPGYGFLSENASFADAVVKAGLIWIGPSPDVLKALESKLYCKRVASKAGVPVIPGTKTAITREQEVLDFIATNGLPVFLKLDKGGGGKGIEVVKEAEKINESLSRIQRIGLTAFANSDCYVETAVKQPRHIEVQFIADQYGKCVCLGERECSIQRRHQKIIEESPSPVVSFQDRQHLFNYTERLVKAMGYTGAGTIEYLRSDDGQYYFMELNARLQVEHPVTEMVTGLDIVREQIKVAQGEKITFTQNDIELVGHAIEARIYAEDPVTFAPSPGLITGLSLPQVQGNHLRIDHALDIGVIVPPYYDPMLAKVITWGATRTQAIERLRDALNQFHVEGIKTSIATNLRILNNEKFCSGSFDITFIETEILPKVV